ncbi:MAG: hypothetical protein ACRC4M_05835 [Mycoplasma sp.]
MTKEIEDIKIRFKNIWKAAWLINALMFLVFTLSLVALLVWSFCILDLDPKSKDAPPELLYWIISYIVFVILWSILYFVISWYSVDKFLPQLVKDIKSIDWNNQELNVKKNNLLCVGKYYPPIGDFKELGWSRKPSILRIYKFISLIK